MNTQCTALLCGRTIYHATPLHYLPSILGLGELKSQRELGCAMGRPTARRRDRLLNVDYYVHCSLSPRTPLLMDKLSKGYPHAILALNTSELPDVESALLPCSTKAWRSKWQCCPVTEQFEMDRILRLYEEGRRFRGLEILIKNRISLKALSAILVASDAEAVLVKQLCNGAGAYANTPVWVDDALKCPAYAPANIAAIAEYFQVCGALRMCLPPPRLPFD